MTEVNPEKTNSLETKEPIINYDTKSAVSAVATETVERTIEVATISSPDVVTSSTMTSPDQINSLAPPLSQEVKTDVVVVAPGDDTIEETSVQTLETKTTLIIQTTSDPNNSSTTTQGLETDTVLLSLNVEKHNDEKTFDIPTATAAVTDATVGTLTIVIEEKSDTEKKEEKRKEEKEEETIESRVFTEVIEAEPTGNPQPETQSELNPQLSFRKNYTLFVGDIVGEITVAEFTRIFQVFAILSLFSLWFILTLSRVLILSFKNDQHQ